MGIPEFNTMFIDDWLRATDRTCVVAERVVDVLNGSGKSFVERLVETLVKSRVKLLGERSGDCSDE